MPDRIDHMRRLRLAVLIAAAVAGVVLIFAYRMPQDPAYHLFADTRTCLGIPNFFNVASNLAFALVGIVGLVWMASRSTADRFIESPERWIFVALFAGTALVMLGSGYYHLAPDNPRLFWDRLPMTVVASAFVAAIIADRCGARAGVWTLAVLAALAAGGLFYWRATLMPGPDNVWPYFATVYGSLCFGVIALALYPSRYTHAHGMWIALGIYAVAMMFDTWLDEPLYLAGNLMSGHTLKHLLAAVAIGWAGWVTLALRRPKSGIRD